MTRHRVQQNVPAMTSLLLPAFANLRLLGWFGIKIIATYLFHYYCFFLEKIAQKAGLIGVRF
jgi:hypothetical protein